MPKVLLERPSRSNVDLGRVTRFSSAAGLLYPVLTEQVFAADNLKLSLSSLIKTLPLQGPLMGSCKVQFDHFFIPQRLYNKLLHDDRSGFDPRTVYFPYFTLNHMVPATAPAIRGNHPSSLFHFLGIPQEFSGTNQDTGTRERRKFNAIPYLGYMDIFRGYYANTQEENAYVMSEDGFSTPKPFNLGEIDQMKQEIFASSPNTPFNVSNTSADVYDTELHCHYPLGGLLCRTYLPDRFNVWINRNRYNEVTASSVVDVSSGSFDMDSLRFANKLNQMLQKTLVSGGRYSDWQEVQYGARLKTLNEVPTFIGTHSTELNFEDVVQTGASTDNDPLGTLGGRGIGFMGNRSVKFYVPENGYIMTIMSIIPRVDYYQGVKHFYRQETISDLHVPTMDGIGYQDLLIDDLYSAFTQTDPDGSFKYSEALGKQPAWTELMTATNELHGEFADPSKLMYLTFARRYQGLSALNETDFTTYMNPAMFNQCFADASGTAENFWVQIKFDLFVQRAISKRLMPYL